MTTPEQSELVRRFADVMLCERMGWTEQEYLEGNTEPFIDDMMAIFGMQHSYQEAQRKLDEAKRKRKGK